MNPNVTSFLKRQTAWATELCALREIFLATELDEALKWGWPCYSLGGKNVALLHSFKAYCAILFHKGALLSDPKRVLIQQTKNVQSARQIRFTNVREITKLRKTLDAYVHEAIANERAGRTVKLKSTSEFEMPRELKAALAASAKLKKAFAALTPGRQRAYMLHVAQPKQEKTRLARVEKHAPRILKGLGLDD